jgi:hypothetical protein
MGHFRHQRNKGKDRNAKTVLQASNATAHGSSQILFESYSTDDFFILLGQIHWFSKVELIYATTMNQNGQQLTKPITYTIDIASLAHMILQILPGCVKAQITNKDRRTFHRRRSTRWRRVGSSSALVTSSIIILVAVVTFGHDEE